MLTVWPFFNIIHKWLKGLPKNQHKFQEDNTGNKTVAAQKKKFPIRNFFSKCDKIHKKTLWDINLFT